MKKKLSISLIILLTGLVSAWAIQHYYIAFNGEQDHALVIDGKDELRKLYQQYMSSSKVLSLSGTIQLLDEENKNALKEETSFESLKMGRSIYTRLSYLQTFINDSITLQLDTVNKTVVVTQTNKELLGTLDQKIFPLEQYLKETSTLKISATVEEEGKERVLMLHNDLTPEIKSTKIYYTPSAYTLKRTEIEWWKGNHFKKTDENKCWLSRINYTGSGSTVRSIDDMLQQIITVQGNHITLTDHYKDYSLQAIP